MQFNRLPKIPPVVVANDSTSSVFIVVDYCWLTGSYHVTPETPVSDSGIDLTLEMEEIDRSVRGGETDDDLVAAAAEEFENLKPSTSGIMNTFLTGIVTISLHTEYLEAYSVRVENILVSDLWDFAF